MFRASPFLSGDLPPPALEALRQMIGQLPIVFALRAGGELRIPVTEVDAAGGYILSIEVQGSDFVFKASKKS
jgi:hypothetical protein